MKPPFLGRRFNNLFNRRRPTLRSLRTFYTRTAAGEQAYEPPKPKDPRRRKKRFLYSRVAEAWYNTPTKWYPLPLGIGIALLAALQFTKNRERWYTEGNPVVLQDEHGEVVKLKGPWQVHVLGALPLRNLSRLWGWMNAIELPYWFRPTGYKIYSWIFGCNLDEVETDDLTVYKSLGEFFYRRLKPGVRPIAGTALVSPADGTILHFGTIDADHGPDAEENDKKQPIRIEQVKGVSYSLDALLGISNDHRKAEHVEFSPRESAEIDDRHFANLNGIEYSLDQLLGSKDGAKEGQSQDGAVPQQEISSGAGAGPGGDASSKDNQRRQSSVLENMVRDSSVAVELGQQSIPSSPPPLLRRSTSGVKPGNQLHFAVIYLAPGDYHRFHSPTAWVVEKRRHFTGELFSVSPYIARRLSNLFVLNERVVLLGRWKHGFFSMVPVGATNVGSIKVNFDRTLRTNLPQRPAPPSPGTYAEATYASASALLRGQPMIAGQEMGGFCLGSTIVLVFEAPKGFEFSVHAGQKVKVGQAMGDIRS